MENLSNMTQKLDSDYKSIPKLESNAKITQNPCEKNNFLFIFQLQN